MTTRRDFIRQATLLGAGLSMSPFFINATPGSVGANDKIRVGLIGCKGMGFSDLQAFLRNPEVGGDDIREFRDILHAVAAVGDALWVAGNGMEIAANHIISGTFRTEHQPVQKLGHVGVPDPVRRVGAAVRAALKPGAGMVVQQQFRPEPGFALPGEPGNRRVRNEAGDSGEVRQGDRRVVR